MVHLVLATGGQKDGRTDLTGSLKTECGEHRTGRLKVWWATSKNGVCKRCLRTKNAKEATGETLRCSL